MEPIFFLYLLKEPWRKIFVLLSFLIPLIQTRFMKENRSDTLGTEGNSLLLTSEMELGENIFLKWFLKQ